MINRSRGRPGNRRLPETITERVLRIIRENYIDFGPTLTREKLEEIHGFILGNETVRRLMIKAGLWVPLNKRALRIQQPRYRRACTGELVQIDDCDHHWFESRAKPCTLLVYVDDATSCLMQLRFVKSESTFTYFEATRNYLDKHGKPMALYSDKASVFRINNKAPRHDFDVHRPLEPDDDLAAVFTWRELRHVSKSLTVQYDKMLYLIEDNDLSRKAIGKYIEVWHYPDGRKELRLNGSVLPYSTYDRLSEIDQGAIVDNKRLGRTLEFIKLVQEKRDNNRSQTVPAGDGPSRRCRKPTEKKSQRSLNDDDMLDVLKTLQSRSEEIFRKRK